MKELNKAFSSKSLDDSKRFWIETDDLQNSCLAFVAFRINEVGRRASHVDNHVSVKKIMNNSSSYCNFFSPRRFLVHRLPVVLQVFQRWLRVRTASSSNRAHKSNEDVDLFLVLRCFLQRHRNIFFRFLQRKLWNLLEKKMVKIALNFNEKTHINILISLCEA